MHRKKKNQVRMQFYWAYKLKIKLQMQSMRKKMLLVNKRSN